MKRLLEVLFNRSNREQIHNLNETKCEIKKLEKEINGTLKKIKHFKDENVTGKSTLDVQLLQAKVVSKTERIKANQIGILFLGIILPIIFYLGLDLDDISPVFSIIFLAIFFVYALTAYFVLDRSFRTSAESHSYLIELVNLLIEKKKKIKNC